MVDFEKIDKQQILQRLRQTLKPQISLAAISKPTTEGGKIDRAQWMDGEEIEDLALLNASFDIYNVPLTSARRFGSAIIRLKSLLRKLLRPSLEQQAIYNSANNRVLQSLYQGQRTLKQDLQADLANRFEEAMDRLEAQTQEIATLKAEIEQFKAIQQQQNQLLEKWQNRVDV